ncbi:MAG: phage replisome organizer [Clostridium butyricum]|nr:phage replisome organizer [Clostridium butyricum]
MKNIKIKVDMYDDTKFKIIDTKPERDLIHYIWTRMLTLAGKVDLDGKLYLSRNIPYTDETLAIEFNRDVMQVKLALKVFLELEMIVVDNDNVYKIKNFSKYQKGNQRKKAAVKQEREVKYDIEDDKKNKDINISRKEAQCNKLKEVEKTGNIKSDNNIKENDEKHVKIEELNSDSNSQYRLADLVHKNKGKRKNSKKINNKDIIEIEEDKDTELIEFYEGHTRPLGKNERIIMEFKV